MAEKKKTADDILKLIKEKDIKFVDVRFTDPRGKWHHVTFDLSMVDDDFLNHGTMFDGSSIAGWKAINESDMLLVPDLDTAVIDPFFAQTTLILVCDVHEPTTGQRYGRCPRSIAKSAEAYVNSSGIGDTTYFGPEAEFFVFDDARFDTGLNKGFYFLDSKEGAWNSGTDYEQGNLGHRPSVRAVISRCRRSIPNRTCAARCSPSWAIWASSRKSTITKSPPPSMNLASSSTR